MDNKFEQVFEQVKAKQRDPVSNNNVSNQNEATQTSNQTIVEKCDDKKLLMIPYQGGKGEQAIKTIRKTIKRLLPSNIKVQVSFTGKKLNSCFNIKDKTKFEHRHDVIYLRKCPETTCNDNYIGEAKRRIFERVKDYNGRDFKSHLLKHVLKQSSTCFRERFQNNW